MKIALLLLFASTLWISSVAQECTAFLDCSDCGGTASKSCTCRSGVNGVAACNCFVNGCSGRCEYYTAEGNYSRSISCGKGINTNSTVHSCSPSVPSSSSPRIVEPTASELLPAIEISVRLDLPRGLAKEIRISRFFWQQNTDGTWSVRFTLENGYTDSILAIAGQVFIDRDSNPHSWEFFGAPATLIHPSSARTLYSAPFPSGTKPPDRIVIDLVQTVHNVWATSTGTEALVEIESKRMELRQFLAQIVAGPIPGSIDELLSQMDASSRAAAPGARIWSMMIVKNMTRSGSDLADVWRELRSIAHP